MRGSKSKRHKKEGSSIQEVRSLDKWVKRKKNDLKVVISLLSYLAT